MDRELFRLEIKKELNKARSEMDGGRDYLPVILICEWLVQDRYKIQDRQGPVAFSRRFSIESGGNYFKRLQDLRDKKIQMLAIIGYTYHKGVNFDGGDIFIGDDVEPRFGDGKELVSILYTQSSTWVKLPDEAWQVYERVEVGVIRALMVVVEAPTMVSYRKVNWNRTFKEGVV